MRQLPTHLCPCEALRDHSELVAVDNNVDLREVRHVDS